MNKAIIPLSIPEPLHKEVRAVAERAYVSQAEVMRQSIRAGLPKVSRAYEVMQPKPIRR